MVEECGCDIEGAKIEAWIELGIFVIELIGMAVAVVLTLGAASPAAGGLIAATRFAIQQIFKKLLEALSKKAIKKALKEAGERAAKQLTTKAGLKHARQGGAATKGLDEAREEYLTNAGIQAVPELDRPPGRRELGRAGHVDGSAGSRAGSRRAAPAIGKGGHGNPLGDMLRGAGGEVLGEFGGAAVSGQLPDLEGVAKSASSGVTGSAMHSTKAGMSDALSGLSVPDLSAGSPHSSAAFAVGWIIAIGRFDSFVDLPTVGSSHASVGRGSACDGVFACGRGPESLCAGIAHRCTCAGCRA